MEFLIENKIKKAFVQEYFDQRNDMEVNKYIMQRTQNSDAFIDAFVFSKSFDGFKFWKDINMKWVDLFESGA